MTTTLYYNSEGPTVSIDHDDNPGDKCGGLVILKNNKRLARRIALFVDHQVSSRSALTTINLHADHWACFVQNPPEWIEKLLYPKGWVTVSQVTKGIEQRTPYILDLIGVEQKRGAR